MFFLAPLLLGSGLSAYGQIQQGKAAEKAAEYNLMLAQAEIRNRELETAEQIRRQRAHNRRQTGQLRVALVNNGTLSTEGTTLDILGESAADFELAIQDTVRQATLEANAIRQKALMGLWEADQQKNAAYLTAGATLLSAAGNAAFKAKSLP